MYLGSGLDFVVVLPSGMLRKGHENAFDASASLEAEYGAYVRWDKPSLL